MAKSSEFDWVETQDGPGLNLSQSAVYVGRSYGGFIKLLKRFPDVKRYESAGGKENYILKKDLDDIKQIRPR